MDKRRIVIVDHDDREQERIANWLGEYELIPATSGREALDLTANTNTDLAIIRWDLQGACSGLETMVELRRHLKDLPVIVMFREIDVKRATIAKAHGAVDFLLKRLVKDRVLRAVAAALGPHSSPRLLDQLKTRLDGESISFVESLEKVARAIDHQDGPILLVGEHGTGKELIATAIHELGGHRQAPFVSLNLATLPPDLIETELFGNVGTTSRAGTAGEFERAAAGTLFGDEIEGLPLSLQAKVLRVIEHGGTPQVRESNSRLVFAANSNLASQVRAGTFREDLYHRIAVSEIRIPPLRERGDDLWLLADHFVSELSGRRELKLARETRVILASYGFPGNVRELRRIIESSIVECDGNEILPSHLPLDHLHRQQGESDETHLATEGYQWPHGLLALPYKQAIDELRRVFSREYLTRRLAISNNNISKAAASAGIDRKTFRDVLKASTEAQRVAGRTKNET